MSVFRSKQKSHFTQVPNETIRSPQLSLKAKGMLALMLSFDADWDFHLTHITSICKEGRDSVRGAVRELLDAGYIQRDQNRSYGKFGESAYNVYDHPVTVDGFSGDGLSGDGKSNTKNNNREEQQREKKYISFIRLANAALIYEHYPKKVGKAAAIKAIDAAIMKGVAHSTLVDSVKEYAAAVKRWPKVDHQFIPHCSTWMNQERWTDDRKEWERDGSSKGTRSSDVGNDSKIGRHPDFMAKEL